MIRWLIQSVADHPDLAGGQPPPGLLAPIELDHYAGYHSPRRRRDWLLGRWTAKQLIGASVRQVAGFAPRLDSFSIVQDAAGAPRIHSDSAALAFLARACTSVWRLSISHSHDHAVAALVNGPQGLRVGIDMQVVDRRNAHTALATMTCAEQQALARTPLTQRTLMTIATDSAKEAVVKAVHLDPRHGQAAVQCLLRPAIARMWQPILVEVEEASLGHSTPLRAVSAWWRVVESRHRPGQQLVVAVAGQALCL